MIKKSIILLFLYFTALQANADYIATQDFVVDVDTTVEIITSGNLSTTIDGSTGELASGLNINYAITTNQALSDLRLRALVLDDASNKQSAFYCTSSGSYSYYNINIIFANYDYPPSSSAIGDCKQSISSPIDNPDTIAYPTTVSIDNSGTISYDSAGYFSSNIGTGTTNLNMSVSTTPKSGTYDFTTALDEPGTYKIEIYIDNIPG